MSRERNEDREEGKIEASRNGKVGEEGKKKGRKEGRKNAKEKGWPESMGTEERKKGQGQEKARG